MAKITETGSNETLTPVNASNDKITLESGDNNDTIVVTGNNDTIIVQANDTGDTVTVTGMNETVSVGNGNNTVNIVGTTASGRNSVTVGNGNDTISISGTTYNNTIQAGNGNDKITVSGTSHNNTITAGTGVDVINITATSTNDFINVGGTTGWFFWKNQGPDPVGADTITVNANVTNDSIFVGNGNATISIAGTSHNDTIIAGDGMDSLTISGTSTNDLINLGSNHTWDGLSGFWSNYEFDREYWTNGAAADGDTVLITGATSKDVISVGNGTNFVTITGASKFDYVYTGNGQNVILISNDASDVIWAGNGGNYISTAGTGDIVHSGSGNDTIVYNAADVLLDGGGGFNTLLVNAHQAAPINLTLSNSPVENFQFIDLTGSGGKANFAGFDTTLDLNVATVNALAGSVVNPFDGKAHTLVVLAGADDVVNMGTGWTNVTPTNEPTLTANELLINGSDAQVLTPVTLTNYQVYTETYHNVTNTLIVDKAGVGVLSFSQSPLNVGIVTLGNLTAPDPETITNTGTAPLTISGISSLSGTEFIIENDTVPDTLKPGQSETFYLKLIGNVAGLATASLTITDNGSTPTQTLTLTGNVHFQTVTEPAFILTTTGSTGPTTLSEGAGSLTANDSAGIGIPIGAALHTGPSHGTVIVNADGSFTYTDTGTTAITYYTPDSFTYTITDSLGFSAPITATIDVADHYTPVIASLGSFTPSSSTFAFSIPEITAESYQVGVGSTVTPETYTYSLSAVAGTNSAALINHGISVNASGIITLSNNITFAQTDSGMIDVSLNVQDFNSHLSATDEVEITLNTPDLFTTGNDTVTFSLVGSTIEATNSTYTTPEPLSFFAPGTTNNTLGGSDTVTFDSGVTGFELTIPATPTGTDTITLQSNVMITLIDNEGGNTINLGSNSTAVDGDSITLTAATASGSTSDTINVYGDPNSSTNPNTITINDGTMGNTNGSVNLSDTINIEPAHNGTTTITDNVGGNTIQFVATGGGTYRSTVNLTDSGAPDTVNLNTSGNTLNLGSSTSTNITDNTGFDTISLSSGDTVNLTNKTSNADTFVLPASWASTDVVQGLFTPGTPTPGNPSENVLNLSSVTGITTADLNNPSLFSVDGSGDLLLTLPGGSIDFTDLTYQPGYILTGSLSAAQLELLPPLFTTGNDTVTFSLVGSTIEATNSTYTTPEPLSFFAPGTTNNTLGGSDTVTFDSGVTGFELTIPATPTGTDTITLQSNVMITLIDNEGGNTINLGSNSTAVDGDSVTLTAATASGSTSDTINVYGDPNSSTNPNTITINDGTMGNTNGSVNLSDTINIEPAHNGTTTITDNVGGNTIQFVATGGGTYRSTVNLTDSGAPDTVNLNTSGNTLNLGSSTSTNITDNTGFDTISLSSGDTVNLTNKTSNADTFVLPASWASTDVVQGLFTPGTPTPGNPSENVLNLSSVTGITTADLNNPSLFSVDGSGDLLLTLPGGSIDFTDLTYQPGYILYSSGNNLADVQLYLDPYIFNYNTQYTTQQTLAPGNTSILDTITLENMPDTTLSTLGSVLSFTINGSDEYAFTLTNPNGSIGEFGNAVLTSPTPGSGAPSEPYETVTFDVEASGSMTPTAYQAFLFDGTSGSGNPNDANLLYGFNENNQTLAGDVNSSSAVSPTTNLTYQSNYISTATDTASEANTLVGNIFDSQNDGMDLSSPLSITFSSNTIIAVAGIDFLIGNIDSVGDGIYSTNGGTFTFGSNNLNAGGGVSDYLVGNIYTGNYGINTTNGIFTFDSNNLSAGGGSFDLLVGNIDTANDGLITTGFNTTFTFDQNMLTVTGTGSGNILVGNIDALIGTSSYTGTFTFDSNTLTVNGAQNGDTLVGNSYTSSTVSDSDPIGISYFSSTYTFDSNTLTVNGTASGDTLVGNIYASTSASDSYPLGLNGFGLCTFASNVLTVNGNDDTLVGNVYASSSASDLNPVGIVASFGPFTFASNQLTANGNDDTLVGNVYASSAGGGSFPIGIESNNINFTVISTFASNTLTVDGSGSGDTLVGNIDADGGTAISAGSSTPSFTFAGNTLVAGSGSEMLTGHILGSVSGSPTLSFTSGDTFMFNANTPQGPGNTPIVDTITDFNVGNHFNSSNLVDTIEFYNIISQNLTTLESQVVVGSDANGGVELGVYDNSTDASNAQTLITNGILPTTGLDLIIDLEINNNIGGGLEGGLNYVSGQNTLQYYISQGDLNVSVFNDYVFDEQNTSPEFVDHGNLDLTHGTISLINMSPDASATTVGEALNFSINNSGDYALTLITPDGFEFGNAVITTIVPGSGSPHDTVNFNVEIAGSTTPIADQAFLFDGTSGSGISGDSNPLYGFGTGDIIAGDLYQSDLTTSATYLSNYISTATDTMTDSNTLVGNIYDDNFSGGGIDLSIYQTISFASNILTAGAGSDFLTGNIYANNDGIDSTNGGLFTFYSNTLSAGGGSFDTQVGNIFGGNDGIDSTNGGSFTFYSNTLSAGGGSFDTQVGNIGAGNDGIDSTNGGSFTFYSNTLSAGCGEKDTLVGNIYAPNDDGIDANGGSYSFGSNTLTVNGTGSGDTLVGNIVGGTDAINIIGGSPSFTFAGNTLVAGTGSETLTGHVTGVSGSGATFTFNGGDTFVFNLNLNPTTAVTDTITDFNVGYNYNSSNNPDMIILNGIGNASQVKFSNDGSNGIDVNVFSNPAHTQQIATIDLLYHSLGSVLQGGEAYASSALTVSPMGNSLHIVIV